MSRFESDRENNSHFTNNTNSHTNVENDIYHSQKDAILTSPGGNPVLLDLSKTGMQMLDRMNHEE